MKTNVLKEKKNVARDILSHHILDVKQIIEMSDEITKEFDKIGIEYDTNPFFFDKYGECIIGITIMSNLHKYKEVYGKMKEGFKQWKKGRTSGFKINYKIKQYGGRTHVVVTKKIVF